MFFSLLGVGVFAQPFSNKRLKRFTTIPDTIKLDTLSVIPNSCFIVDEKGKIVDSTYYAVDFSKALLIPNQKLKRRDLKALRLFTGFFRYHFQEYISIRKRKN